MAGGTVGGLGHPVGILGLLNLGLDQFGQIQVPDASHLQCGREEISRWVNKG